MTIQEALDSIKIQNVDFECVSLAKAKGRVLAKPINARFDAPLFSNSAMDGYAIKAAELKSEPKIIACIFAGDMNDYEIKSGECAKIMTGARLPKGADAVLMVENASQKDGRLIAHCESIKVGEAVRMQGEEYKKGDEILRPAIITDEIIMILASNAQFSVEVAKQPRVGIYASGLELIEPYMSGAGVYNSNAYGVYSGIKDICKAQYLGILKDEYEYVKNALAGAFDNFDLVVSIGAASVGDADFIKKALAELGFKAVFTKVKIKPAGPVSLYEKDGKFILVLPGNPMSAYVGTLIYARTLIYRLQGIDYAKTSYKMPLAQDLSIKNNKENIVFGTVINDSFMPFNEGKISSGQLTPLYKNSHYIIAAGELKKGSEVRVYEKTI